MSAKETNEVARRVGAALADLADNFLPHVRLTFVMRDPGNSECHMVITDDNLGELAGLLLDKYDDEEERE